MESIFAYSLENLPGLIAQIGQPSFRTKQLSQWLYRHGARTYDDMTNLPKVMREALIECAPLQAPHIVDCQISRDGTRKFLLELADGAVVETVAIPSRDTDAHGSPRRLTVCISTQVGCPMACAFCATGQEGLTRNLLPGEIAWQVIVCQNEMDMRVTNVVAMGQGEPFLNYDNVIGGLRIINSPDCLGIGARHISLSTCGIPHGIERFGTESEQFTLAVSLHCAIQRRRNRLMPHCASFPLDTLHDSLENYQQSSGRRITFEYLMIDETTDDDASLKALIDFCRELKVHINLLKVNEVEGSPFHPSSDARMHVFLKGLEHKNIEATVRDSRGSDIDGACGQLKNNRRS